MCLQNKAIWKFSPFGGASVPLNPLKGRFLSLWNYLHKIFQIYPTAWHRDQFEMFYHQMALVWHKSYKWRYLSKELDCVEIFETHPTDYIIEQFENFSISNCLMDSKNCRKFHRDKRLPFKGFKSTGSENFYMALFCNKLDGFQKFQHSRILRDKYLHLEDLCHTSAIWW